MPEDKSTTIQECTWELLLDNYDLTQRRLLGLDYTYYSIPTVDQLRPAHIRIFGFGNNENLTIDEAAAMMEALAPDIDPLVQAFAEEGRLSFIRGDWSSWQKDKRGVDMASEVGSYRGVTIRRESLPATPSIFPIAGCPCGMCKGANLRVPTEELIESPRLRMFNDTQIVFRDRRLVNAMYSFVSTAGVQNSRASTPSEALQQVMAMCTPSRDTELTVGPQNEDYPMT